MRPLSESSASPTMSAPAVSLSWAVLLSQAGPSSMRRRMRYPMVTKSWMVTPMNHATTHMRNSSAMSHIK